MYEVLDKSILFICSVFLYVTNYKSSYIIIPILLALFSACLMIYFQNKILHILFLIINLVFYLLIPPLTLFSPVLLYDFFVTKRYYVLIFLLYIINANSSKLGTDNIVFTILFCLLSFYLKHKTYRYRLLRKLQEQTVNNSVELFQTEKEKTRSILENQDYEINIATLNERNRISKEIHDHIGHVLSRSLIQIGALLALEKEPFIKEELGSLKNSLSEGMDSIRASIHNMHDESIDLYSTIQSCIRDFHFCEIKYQYDILNSPQLKIKYCFIAIVKEALANIIKHSNAATVVIALSEEPALYRLIIEDNGDISEKTRALARRVLISDEYTDGMGLQNMIERVKGLHGNIQIIADCGFKIFISIPKENTGG